MASQVKTPNAVMRPWIAARVSIGRGHRRRTPLPTSLQIMAHFSTFVLYVFMGSSPLRPGAAVRRLRRPRRRAQVPGVPTGRVHRAEWPGPVYGPFQSPSLTPPRRRRGPRQVEHPPAPGAGRPI